MSATINYLHATFKAAWFSETVSLHYKNTWKEAAISCLVPLAACAIISYLFMAHILCNHFPCHNAFWLSATYISAFWTVFVFAFPKFLMFFLLVWGLCRLFSQTEYFCAFMAANNWFYVLFTLQYWLATLIPLNDVPVHPMAYKAAITFYLCLVVFFLAHNVLRLRQEIAWIVPACFLFAHAVVRAISGKHGMMFVF